MLAVMLLVAVGLIGSSLAGNNIDPAVELAHCRSAVARWISTNRGYYEQALAPPISCAWRPGEGSGEYVHATGRIIIKPWGRIHWALTPGVFYPAILSHEVAHAYGDQVVHLDRRLTEYAAIRHLRLDRGPTIEDYALTVVHLNGGLYRWYPCEAGYCWPHAPTASEIRALHRAGFLPPNWPGV